MTDINTPDFDPSLRPDLASTDETIQADLVDCDIPASDTESHMGYMVTGLFNSAHGTIRGLGVAVTQVIDVLTTVNHLSDYSYPEAIQLREGIIGELQKLTGVLAVVNARLDEDPEHPALEPRVSVDSGSIDL